MLRRFAIALGRAVRFYDAHNPVLLVEQKMHDERVRKAILRTRPGR